MLSIPLICMMLSVLIPVHGQAESIIRNTGVVVEEVGKNSAFERVGIQPGDVLLSWEHLANLPANPTAASGIFDSPFDLEEVRIEQAPRGAVTIIVRHSGRKLSLSIKPGDWDLKIRPQMAVASLKRYEEGSMLVRSGKASAGTAIWREMAAAVQQSDSQLSSWLLLRAGDELKKNRHWEESLKAYAEALESAKRVGRVFSIAWILVQEGDLFQQQSDQTRAEETYKQALHELEEKTSESLVVAHICNRLSNLQRRSSLTLAEAYANRSLAIIMKLAPNSLDLATSFHILGNIAEDSSDLAAAEEYYKKALDIRAKLAPNSLLQAASFYRLSVVALIQGDIDVGEAYLKEAIVILEKLAPASADLAYSFMNLGNVGLCRGDLAAAEEFLKKALTINMKLGPDSLDIANCFNNLGCVAEDRGDFVAAEEYHKKALAINEKLEPGSLRLAPSFHNLGNVALNRGDLVTAEEYFKKALAIQEKLEPNSRDLAAIFNALGQVASERDNIAVAEEYHKKALVLIEKLVPNSLDLAACFGSLGYDAEARGDLDAMEVYYKKAIAIQVKLAPNSPVYALFISSLGDVASKRGKLAEAKAYYKMALDIQEKLVPGSTELAMTLHDLGKLFRKEGKNAEAGEYFRRAIEALEAQRGKLGGSEEVKAGFAAKYSDYYRDYIDLLIETNRNDDAFSILERSRARSLLAMLAERDLIFSMDIPPELERERKLTDSEYDNTQAAIRDVNPVENKDEVEQLLGRLHELRDRQQSITDKIRKASPHYASLQYPQPLDVTQLRKVLDKGTVMLAYSVGKEQCHLFVLSESGLSVFPIALQEGQLRKEVEKFRSLILRRRDGFVATAGIVAQGRLLYDALVRPADALVVAAQRILIVPDGPLHLLPFGALVRAEGNTFSDRNAKNGRSWRFLLEWKPLHTIVSGTVYAEVKKSRAPATERLTAFGDPLYPARSSGKVQEPADASVHSFIQRGLALKPLPGTRREVSAIVDLYGKAGEAYLGEAATEDRVKALPQDIRYIHFACHAWPDERFPLNSALALTIPQQPVEGQDNGLLQAWEIFEQVRTNADLVVLSACETGLGKEMGGEGLIGLTRAFQYAGARSIVASLWGVSDESTADLMKRFYGYLKVGLSKDEALRAAQIDLASGRAAAAKSPNSSTTDTSNPYFWAAFELIGDWR